MILYYYNKIIDFITLHFNKIRYYVEDILL